MTELKIYVDRLQNGQHLKIDDILSPDFLDVDDDDLAFKEPVHVKGEAYLADDHLVIQLSIDTIAILPCSICNERITLPIQLENIYLTQPLNEIQGAVFDLSAEVREAVLLQTPLFLECSGGKCPERESMKKFFKEESPSSKDDETVNFPFANLT